MEANSEPEQCISWLLSLAADNSEDSKFDDLPERIVVLSEEVKKYGARALSISLIEESLKSVREMKDTFGLQTLQARMAFEKAFFRQFGAELKVEDAQKEAASIAEHKQEGTSTAKIPQAKQKNDSISSAAAAAVSETSPKITGSQGGLYSEEFLKLVRPLYDMHMGVENMGPLLYALVRFLKPLHVLELGAGYTSIYLLQALRDNHLEMQTYEIMRARDEAHINGTPWCVDSYLKREEGHKGTLHTVDNMAHAHTTADKVKEIGAALGLETYFKLYEADAYTFASETLKDLSLQLDFMWIDLGAANRMQAVMKEYFPYVKKGGFLLVHSTLTNMLSRQWLEEMRAHQRVDFEVFQDGSDDPVQKERMITRKWFADEGQFVSLSLLEPHKVFQNSCTLFQKRGGGSGDDGGAYKEPVYTQYP